MMPMYELEKAYEPAEILMALDLPISKAQIEEIWSLENNNTWQGTGLSHACQGTNARHLP